MHSYLLLVSSLKGAFAEEFLEIGLFPLIWACGTHEEDQISLTGTGRWIVMVWEEERGGKGLIEGIWQRG
jgi:hypothetical protein